MTKFDNFIYGIAQVAVIIGGIWLLSTILYDDVPSYVKQMDMVLLVGLVIVFYYDKVKNKPNS